jgi:Tfp pilus assembly protein PilO
MVTQLMARARLKPMMVNLIGGGLLLALFGLWGGLAFWPMRERVADIEQQSTIDKALLQRAAEVEADHQDVEKQLSEKLRQVKSLEKRVPPHAQEADFFGQVAHLAQERGIKIHGFRPVASAAQKDYHVVKVAFDATGEYEPLCHFLTELGTLSRLNHITRMHLGPESPGSKGLTVKIETDIYHTNPAANGGRS